MGIFDSENGRRYTNNSDKVAGLLRCSVPVYSFQNKSVIVAGYFLILVLCALIFELKEYPCSQTK